MLSRKQVLSAMAGLAMIATPVSALAKHHDDYNNALTYAWHDHGRHNGWAKHQLVGEVPPPIAHRYYADEARHDWDDDRHQWRHRDCDENYGSRHWQNNGGYDYGAPSSWYEGQPPASANVMQQRAWLINRRQHAMALIAQMRARGDSRGAKRVVSSVRALNGQIASTNSRLGYNSYSGYAPSAGYGPAVNYAGVSPLLNGAAPYYGNSNPYLGNTAYTGDPTTDALVSMVPILLGPH